MLTLEQQQIWSISSLHASMYFFFKKTRTAECISFNEGIISRMGNFYYAIITCPKKNSKTTSPFWTRE